MRPKLITVSNKCEKNKVIFIILKLFLMIMSANILISLADKKDRRMLDVVIFVL